MQDARLFDSRGLMVQLANQQTIDGQPMIETYIENLGARGTYTSPGERGMTE